MSVCTLLFNPYTLFCSGSLLYRPAALARSSDINWTDAWMSGEYREPDLKGWVS